MEPVTYHSNKRSNTQRNARSTLKKPDAVDGKDFHTWNDGDGWTWAPGSNRSTVAPIMTPANVTAPVAAPVPATEPEAAHATTVAAKVKRAPKIKAPKPAKVAKVKATKAPRVKTERAARKPKTGGKNDQLIALLSPDKGATMPYLMEKLEWLGHTTRAAISRLGTAGHKIERTKPEGGGVSTYRIVV